MPRRTTFAVALVALLAGTAPADEPGYYPATPFPVPAGCVLEVGGLGFRPDGSLMVCTRRGEIWRVTDPTDPPRATFTRFAAGLHEPLGLKVIDNNTVLVVQRPELTRVTDTDGDGRADSFETLADGWGLSADYHEFAYGPAIDQTGAAFVTLNVGFGGGHQSKAKWRGWCVRVPPGGGPAEPFAAGLRSPNGVAVSPAGELFFTDNQGEWCPTNKLSRLEKGRFYGHPAGLRWAADSPFAATLPAAVKAGLRYDGGTQGEFPAGEPPAVWFPYGRMGQSASEPAWDTTGGKFGPFAGDLFVGDQTRSLVMRVHLDVVNGVTQGACFPFRSGLQCGVNRLAFGPDGALYAGQTARGWGSVGGKPYGLERVAFGGAVLPELKAVLLAADGFDLAFTAPVRPATLTAPGAVAVKSFTYYHHAKYGSPEVDDRAEPVGRVTAAADGRTAHVPVAGVRRGRVYEVRLAGVEPAGGGKLAHAEAYYTVNAVPR